MKSGEWRFRVRWLPSPPRFWYRVERFEEGTVYVGRCAWLFLKLMVKA